VTVTFLVYEGAAESGGLAWMGQKMKAGQLLYGDNAAGALVQENEEDEEDLRREMIRLALQASRTKLWATWSTCSPIRINALEWRRLLARPAARRPRRRD